VPERLQKRAQEERGRGRPNRKVCDMDATQRLKYYYLLRLQNAIEYRHSHLVRLIHGAANSTQR
jgi:hypothetical protein